MNTYLKSVFASLLIIYPVHLPAADFEIRTAVIGTVIKIDGEIVKGDYQKFIEKSKNALSVSQGNGNKVWVSITSKGGDLLEAIRIGQAIREMRIFTTMGSECFSACFFILVSGVHRLGPSQWSNGILGVHRPFFEPTYFAGLSSRLAEEKYNQLLQESSHYLREMGVSDRLIDFIKSVPSGELVRLSSQEYDKEVGLQIPYWQEWITSKCGPELKGQELEDYKKVLGAGIVGEEAPFSSGYADFLKSKVKDRFDCTRKVGQETQVESMRRFLR